MGYIGRSMSERAAEAYAAGRMPISRITAADLREHGITIRLADFRRLASAGVIRTGEWHHTGKHFAKTEFWCLTEAAEQLAEIDVAAELEKIAADEAAKASAPAQRVVIWWEEFDRRIGRRGGFRDRGPALGVVDGAWVRLDDGTRKKRDGSHVTIANVDVLTGRQLVAWRRAGFDDIDAHLWASAGFTAAEARRWSTAGFDRQDAGRWRDADATPAAAAKWNARGLTDIDYRQRDGRPASAGINTPSGRA